MRVEMVRAAVLPETGEVPRGVEPSMKITVPVAPLGTLAVKVVGAS
jgi:hypothetical protein